MRAQTRVGCGVLLLGLGCCAAGDGTARSQCASSLAPSRLSIDRAWSTAELDALPPDYPAVVRTVVAGDTREDLSVRFLGLYPDQRSGFLLWLETDPCEPRWARWHGVAAGMSGSPVVIDGRLAGALSSRFGSTSGPAFPFAATPMDVVLGVTEPRGHGPQVVLGVTEPRGHGAQVVPTLLQPVPLVLNSGAAREIRDDSQQADLDVEASSEDGEPPVSPPDSGVSDSCTDAGSGCRAQRLSPGDGIAVNVLTSNLYTIAAMGTVTAVDGDRVWAFGHPFLASGDSALPFSGAEVFGLSWDPVAGPTKVMSPKGAVRGTIRRDQYGTIAGTFDDGVVPSMTFTTHWIVGDGEREDAVVMEHRMPLVVFDGGMESLAPTAIAQSLDYALDHQLVRGTVRVEATVTFEGSDAVMRARYAREAEADAPLANQEWAGELMEALAALRARFPDHHAKHIDLWGAYSEQASHLELLSMDVFAPDGSGPVAVDVPVAVRPGEALHVEVRAFDGAAKALVDLPVDVHVPAETTTGPIVLQATRSPAGRVPVPALEHYARSFEQEVEAINDAAGADDTVFVTLYGVDASASKPMLVQEIRVRMPSQIVSVGLPITENADFAANALRIVDVLEPVPLH